MHKFDVAIIGGGAAGLACAVSLKKFAPSLSVAIVEAGARLGKKLAATGNGQGNVSNTDMSPCHFHGSFAPLAARLCREYDVLGLFDSLFTSDKSGKIYPSGKQASSLSDCLIRKVGLSGAEVFLNSKVTAVGGGFSLSLSDGKKLAANRVVLAAGGCAQKQFLTDGNAFNLARSMGHSVTPLYPSLVQLKTDTTYIKTLKGIRTECNLSAFSSDGALIARSQGDVIFTDYGVSGNAVFGISSHIADLKDVTISIEFLPEFTREEVLENMRKKQSLGYEYSELLSGSLHNQTGRAIMRRADGAPLERAAELVKNFTLKVTGSLGFDYAQVTKGGVPFSEVNENLESKLKKGLYLVGEVVDLDGDCGGYNLTWAFSSGMHAAAAIAKESSKEGA